MKKVFNNIMITFPFKFLGYVIVTQQNYTYLTVDRPRALQNEIDTARTALFSSQKELDEIKDRILEIDAERQFLSDRLHLFTKREIENDSLEEDGHQI